MKLSIAPHFLPGESGDFFFTERTLNKLSRARYQDDFGFYQSRFNVFSYMQMNSRRKFVVHYPKGSPLVWQKYQGCTYDNTGSISLDRREITPDPIYMREQFCHDSLLDSCFQHMINYTTGGDITLDEEGVRIFNMLVDELMTNAQLGFRMSALTGQMYNVETVEYSNDNTANLTELFKKTHPSVKGLIKLAYDRAQIDAPQLNVNVVNDSDFNAMGQFQGDPIEVVEAIMDKAKKPLRQLYNRGATISNGRFTFAPLIIASDGYYNAFLDKYKAEGDLSMTNRTKLSKRDLAPENSNMPMEVMYLYDRIPIIPLSEINGFDQYVAGDLHTLMVVGSGNMQIGASFSSLPQDIENRGIGVMIGRNDDMHDDAYGTYTVLSHALAKTAIADTDYMAGTIKYVKPT